MPPSARRAHQIREVFPNVTALLAAAFFLGAAPLAHAQKPLAVNEVAPGVFVHQGRYEIFTPRNSGDTSNAGFIIGRDGVAVIDTGGSPRVGTELLAAIRARTKLPVKYVINTHMHPDHVFGNVAFEGEKPMFVGHVKLPRALAARAERYLARNKELLGEAFEGTRIIPPTELVKDRLELDLGDRKLLIEAHATAHTDNDVTVLDEKTGTMFLGDLLFAKHVPALDGSIRGWLDTDRQPQRRARTCSSPCRDMDPHQCRGRRRSPPSSVISARVADDVRGMIKQGKTLAEAAATAGLSEKDAWLLFKDYHARNVSAAFAELEWE